MSAWRPGQWKILPLQRHESMMMQNFLIGKLNEINEDPFKYDPKEIKETEKLYEKIYKIHYNRL